jgi:hypothetical protein
MSALCLQLRMEKKWKALHKEHGDAAAPLLVSTITWQHYQYAHMFYSKSYYL